MRAAAIVALGAALGAALLLSGFGGESEPAEVPRPIVLVSGRDDHGLLVQKTVGLSQFAGGEENTRVPDGTLVRVEATRGEWLQVRTLERTSARGWVNDYFLRGTAHVTQRVAPFPLNAQVELLELAGARVRARSIETGTVAWVPRAAVAELPSR